MPPFTIPLKPCPWCHHLPDLILSYDDTLNTNGTWLWYIRCSNLDCNVKPKSRHVSIRNSGKLVPIYLRAKLCKLEDYWNGGLTSLATEGKLVDLDKLISNYRKYSEKQSEV